jgi:hypothetical protein
MAQHEEPTIVRMSMRLAPFDAPGAQDYYMNLTGVLSTPHEIVLMFAKLIPPMAAPEGGEVVLPPALRVTLPVAAGRRLAEQLTQMLDARERRAAERNPEESEDAGTPANG